jgi:hypothetical protein
MREVDGTFFLFVPRILSLLLSFATSVTVFGPRICFLP